MLSFKVGAFVFSRGNMMLLYHFIAVSCILVLRTMSSNEAETYGGLDPPITVRRFSALHNEEVEFPAPEAKRKCRSHLSYTVDSLLSLRNPREALPSVTMDAIRQLGIGRNTGCRKRKHRGTRGGVRLRRKIPTLIGHRGPPNLLDSYDDDGPTRNISNLTCIQTSSHTKTLDFPTFMLLNSRSLNNKLDEFSSYLRCHNIDVAAVTETWFRPDLPEEYVSIENYDLFVKSRSQRRGGGVCLYAKRSLNPLHMPNVVVPDNLEVVWIKLSPKKLPRSVSIIAVAVIYHPPNAATAEELIDHLLESMDRIASKHPSAGFVLMGDFNELDTTPLTLNRDFVQVVDRPTRGNVTLDKIVSNLGHFYLTPLILPPLGSSDHSAVLWSPSTYVPKPNRSYTRTTRPMPDSAIREFGQKLLDCDWSSVYDADEVEAKCDEFYSTLSPLIDTYFPTRNVKVHDNDKPWISPIIKSLIKQRQSAFAAGKSARWRQLRNKIARCISSAKQKFYADRVQGLKKSNPAKWHKNLKSMIGIKQTPTIIEVEGTENSDFPAIAGKINEFFIDVAKDIDKLDRTALPSFLPAPAPMPLVQPWEIYDELKCLNPRKAPGPDGIPARLIAEFAYELSTPLTHVINSSFSQVVMPKQWKRAIIVPIPKKPKPSIQDLRPISLTDHFAKITEKFVTRLLVKGIGESIDPSQFGNRKNHSTAHYLIDLLRNILRNADKPKAISTILAADFSKAFDRIKHNIAIPKMLEMKAPPAVVAWVCSFLSDREQCVKYMSTYSDWMKVTAGTPQGTLLGPIIFLCMINDACRESELPCWKYVDDLTLLECRKTTEPARIQENVNDLNNWTNNNDMRLNPKKCVVMNVSFMRSDVTFPKVTIGNHELSEVTVVKLLGVLVQNDLKWNCHVNDIVKRASMRLHMLRILKGFKLPVRDLLTVYCTYVRPVVEYCAPVWHSGLTEAQKTQIERIQRRACRLMLGPHYCNYAHALDSLKLPSLDSRREKLTLKLGRGLTRPQSPFSHWLPPTRSESNARSLRNGNTYSEVFCKTERYRTSAFPYIIRMLNANLA